MYTKKFLDKIEDKIRLFCKHGEHKEKCTECFEEKFGKSCPSCGLRKSSFASIGTNLPSLTSVCKCDNT